LCKSFCPRYSLQRQSLIAMWRLPYRSCSADLSLIGFHCGWVLVLCVGLYFLSTFNKKPVCCVLEYCLKPLLFNTSAEGFLHLFVPFTVECHLALSLSLPPAYLLPLRYHTALFSLTHHFYIGHVQFYILL